jgi:hypothetical protein
MASVGYSWVANQANTTDGFADGVVANNDPADDTFGTHVGDGGVVDLYHNGGPTVLYYILMENAGYILKEDGSKIVLESS